MINDTQVSNLCDSTETQSKVADRASARVCGRASLATVLGLLAVAALAITSVLQSNERATAQSEHSMQSVWLPSVQATSVPLDSGEVGPFAFGYLVFENDPAQGVHGFGPLPPRSTSQ
jgi:hypothetical protein